MNKIILDNIDLNIKKNNILSNVSTSFCSGAVTGILGPCVALGLYLVDKIFD